MTDITYWPGTQIIKSTGNAFDIKPPHVETEQEKKRRKHADREQNARAAGKRKRPGAGLTTPKLQPGSIAIGKQADADKRTAMKRAAI